MTAIDAAKSSGFATFCCDAFQALSPNVATVQRPHRDPNLIADRTGNAQKALIGPFLSIPNTLPFSLDLQLLRRVLELVQVAMCAEMG